MNKMAGTGHNTNTNTNTNANNYKILIFYNPVIITNIIF